VVWVKAKPKAKKDPKVPAKARNAFHIDLRRKRWAERKSSKYREAGFGEITKIVAGQAQASTGPQMKCG
jgi:hypothetical protein